MARYTVHVPKSEMSMGLDSPLTGLEAYHKVRELRAMGFEMVSLRTSIRARRSWTLPLSFETVRRPSRLAWILLVRRVAVIATPRTHPSGHVAAS